MIAIAGNRFTLRQSVPQDLRLKIRRPQLLDFAGSIFFDFRWPANRLK